MNLEVVSQASLSPPDDTEGGEEDGPSASEKNWAECLRPFEIVAEGSKKCGKEQTADTGD